MDQPEVDILTRVSVNDEPLSYPGRIEAGSYLLCGTRVSSLSFATDRRLGQSMVLPYGERPGVGEAHDFTRLNYQLLIDNAASIDRRMPVVAIGSNAAARQLYDKLVRAGASTTVPVVKAGLHGIAIAASAHVSDPGYIAVAPTQHPDKDACVEVFVAFLDQRQVNVVDASERNYERVCLSGDHYRLELDSGEVLGSFYVYRTRRGVIADSWRLLQPLTDSQPRLIRELLEGYTLGDELDIGSPEQFPKDMSGNSEQRRRFTEALKRRGLVVPDGLDASQQGTPQLTYGDIETNLQRLSIEQREAGYRWVDRTPHTLRRDGDHCIAITTAQANELGVKVYAQVSHRVYDREIAVIAKVIRLDVEVGDHDRVLLDQAVRNGIGIEIRERVLIRPARVPSSILGDLLLGRRKYLLARSQRADLSTMESGICALPAVDLGVLGVAPGDEVILEGPVDEHRRARHCIKRTPLQNICWNGGNDCPAGGYTLASPPLEMPSASSQTFLGYSSTPQAGGSSPSANCSP